MWTRTAAPGRARARLFRDTLRLAVVAFALTAPCWSSVAPAAADATPCADLQISNVGFTPAQPVAGQPSTVDITITNAGTCDAGGSVVQFQESFFGPVTAGDSVALAAGDSTTVHLPYTFQNPGNFQTIVQVNTNHAVSETNFSNDLQIAPVTVVPAGPHLVVTGFSVAPGPTGHVVVGKTVTATFKVTNTGNAPAGAFDVQWTPYFLATPLHKHVTGLNAGDSVTVTMDFAYPFAATVTGTAQAVEPITDIPLSDAASLDTEVQPDLPNLAFASGEEQTGIVVHPAPAGQDSTVTVTVVNDGNEPAGPFVVSWQPWLFGGAESQSVNGLDVGQSAQLTFHYTFPFAGGFDGTVTLDSTNVIAEVYENDNTAPTHFDIPAATVDLTPTNVTISPSTPTQGAPATVTVTVKNQGNVPSGTFRTSWNPDAFGIIEPSPGTLTRDVPSLDPGQSTDVVFTFTYPQPGNFRSIAGVQTLNGVTDVNTSNDQRILNVSVNPAQLDLRFSTPSITFNPASPVRGTDGTASVTVVNNGPIASGAFFVELLPQAGGFPQFQYVNGLNVHESRTVTFTVNYFTTGTFTATATVDPFNWVVKSASAQANDVINQQVTVVPQTATVNVSLDHLHIVDSDSDDHWDNIVYLVFDPSSSCDLHVDANSLHIHQTIPAVSCQYSNIDHINSGNDVGIHQSHQVTLVEGTPLAAAVGVAESDFAIPDIPGLAFFLSGRPAYLHLSGLQQAVGQQCTEVDLSGSHVRNGGHCFDAYFGVSVSGFTGPSMARMLRPGQARAASAKTAPPIPASAKAVAAAKRYVAGAFRRIRGLVTFAATHGHVRPGGVHVTAISTTLVGNHVVTRRSSNRTRR